MAKCNVDFESVFFSSAPGILPACASAVVFSLFFSLHPLPLSLLTKPVEDSLQACQTLLDVWPFWGEPAISNHLPGQHTGLCRMEGLSKLQLFSGFPSKPTSKKGLKARHAHAPGKSGRFCWVKVRVVDVVLLRLYSCEKKAQRALCHTDGFPQIRCGSLVSIDLNWEHPPRWLLDRKHHMNEVHQLVPELNFHTLLLNQCLNGDPSVV